jgi:HPt (histidine-containing phosphotransfer) domain-containing protein
MTIQDTLEELDPECQLPPQLLGLFLRAAPRQLAELIQYCDARDTENARAQAHKLKGGLYVVGACRLAEGLETLRGTLSTVDWAAALEQLAGIQRAFRAVTAELERRAGEAAR